VKAETLKPELRCAIEAAHNKKAGSVTLLDLDGLGAFTGYFLICTGFSERQVSAIASEIEDQLHVLGIRIRHREGGHESEWVLLDYGNFLVHVFTERARIFYDLERLWRSAKRTEYVDPAIGANVSAMNSPASASQIRGNERSSEGSSEERSEESA
jgi:ribosome-associated protein